MNYYDKDEVLLKATGMWPHLLQQLTGLDSSVFSKKHQPCPMCGGTDRFRFDDNRNTRGDGGYICNPAVGCGAGDGLSLYMKSTGIEFGEAIRNLGDAMALIPVERIELVRKQIKASQTLPKRAITFHEEATNILKCCAEHQKTPPFFARHSDNLHRVSILNDFDSVYPVINAGGSIVNAAIVDPYGDVEFAGGEITNGGFTSIGNNTDKWIICTDISNAIKIHEQTGSRVICTWGDLNLDEVLIGLGKLTKRCFIAANYGDIDTVKTADCFNVKVVLPMASSAIIESGIERKSYSADKLLDEWVVNF